jgi:hypothetical protein
MTMKPKKTGLRVKSSLKVGIIAANHNRPKLGGLRVKSAVKAGGTNLNHSVVMLAPRA